MFQVIVKFAGSLWFIENYNTAIALTKLEADALDIAGAYMINVDTLELTHV